MTDAPEKIWATGNLTTGSWNHEQINERIAPHQTEYIRADIHAAEVAAAIQKEREACAAIATAYHQKALNRAEETTDDDLHQECASTSGSIAAAIRARFTESEESKQ